MKFYFSIFFCFLLTACAGTKTVQLNNTNRSILIDDIAVMSKNAPKVHYEIQEKGGVSVGYNLRFSGDGDLALRLIFRNKSNTSMLLTPRISLINNNDFEITSQTFQSMIADALADTDVRMPQVAAQQTYYNSGRITDVANGRTYTYQGTTSQSGGSFANGYSIGSSVGAALAEANSRADAIKYANFLTEYWLRASYELDPGISKAGVLLYRNQKLNAPYRLRVFVSGQQFEFVTN